jgi:hypothetical protein
MVIANLRLPIAELKKLPEVELPIGNRKSAIGNNKGPALTTRSLKTELIELFSGLFYVAASRFNSPRQIVKWY